MNEARIDGDQARCWNCPATLGQIVPPDRMVEGVWAVALPEYYRSAPVPTALAAVGIVSVVIIAPRALNALAKTGLPWRRRRATDGEGGVRISASRQFQLPALVPCRRPGCGKPNIIPAGGA